MTQRRELRLSLPAQKLDKMTNLVSRPQRIWVSTDLGHLLVGKALLTAAAACWWL